jgi:hypothetical protein
MAKATVQGQGAVRFACDIETEVKEKLAPSEGLAG